MRRTLLIALAAALATADSAHAQRQGELAIGAGLGLGTRTGLVVTIRAMASDDAGISCRVGGPIRGAAVSCGGTFYFSDRQFAIAELGFWTGARDGAPANRLFAGLGTGITGEEDDMMPVYDVGTTLFFARQTIEDGRWGPFRADDGWSFFADLYVEKIVNRDQTTLF